MIILGIETSCDETSCAIVEDGNLLANVVISQVEIHKEYGGVVPEIASRNHIENIIPILNQTLEDANKRIEDITACAVTVAPGLIGALFVGTCFAKTLSYALDIPCLPVHHIDAHIQSIYLEHKDIKYPYVAFILSGGHTQIVFCNSIGDYKILGTTLDDSVGEAYDKVARLLNLGYPGGPIIDSIAKDGDKEKIKFPKVFLDEGSLDFSLSGLKTAVYYFLKKNKGGYKVEDICASFQKSVSDVILKRIEQIYNRTGCKRYILCGGVAANSFLRKVMKEKISEYDGEFYVPSLEYCTDNAAMVALAAYRNYVNSLITSSALDLNPEAYLNITDFFKIQSACSMPRHPGS
ncbi:MAG: tRNA (adenosine(37)-N6)-threonylcarbamoyltransferase complex transferase subunit TsaD [Candidatus Hydrogenedentota bacterium]